MSMFCQTVYVFVDVHTSNTSKYFVGYFCCVFLICFRKCFSLLKMTQIEMFEGQNKIKMLFVTVDVGVNIFVHFRFIDITNNF